METPSASSAENSTLTRGTHRAIDRLADSASRAVACLDRLRQTRRSLVDCGRAVWREHPLKTVAVATACGYLLCRLGCGCATRPR